MLSTSVASRSPVSVGVPGVPLATPPASVTVAGRVAGDHRRIVLRMDGDRHHLRGAVAVSDLNVSVSVPPPFSACTAAWLLSSV